MTLDGKRKFILIGVVLLMFVLGYLFWIKQGTSESTGRERSSTKAATSVADQTASRAPAESATWEKRTAEEKPEQWRTIAKGGYLQLVNPQSLTITRGVVALLDLTPSESKELNMDLESFIDRLRGAEKKHAYVLARSDGSEQIVVEPFDRGPLIRKFRETVAGHLSQNVADFCAEQMRYDATLALGNGEVRLHIETDENGRDLMVLSRGVHRRNSTGDPKWEGDAAPPVVTRLPAQKDFGIRYRHLGSAVKTLPRKTDPGK